MEIYLPNINPINFTEVADKNSGDLERTYIQQYLLIDTITLQLIGDPGLSAVAIIGSNVFVAIETAINDSRSAYTISIGLGVLPMYKLLSISIQVRDNDGNYVFFNSQDYVEIVACDTLTLIEYYHDSNINPFNAYFGGGVKFSIRVPVGYKSTSYTENLVSETFRNQEQELKQLYAHPYRTQKLIIGDSLGVPTWMGNLINNIFCLSHVYVGGKRIVRSEDSTPERIDILDGYPLHIYTMNVEDWDNITIPITTKGDFNNDFNNDFRV